MNNASTPLVLLQRRNRHQKWMFALTVATVGLAVSLAIIWSVQSAGEREAYFKKAIPQIWLVSLALTACAVVTARWWRNRAPESTARELDTVWSAKNRLEAVCELRDATTPLAEAQRAETEQFLAALPNTVPSPVPLWPFAAAAVLLLFLHAGTGVYWLQHAPASKKAAAPVVPIPTAEFKWKSPKPESKATKIEEVPLTAEIRSDTGVGELALEISVNGELKKTVALPAEPFGIGGSHPLKVSMYLDELDVEPYDIVSYNLRGQRNFSSKLAATVSPLQFIQIRPFREDAIKAKSGGSCKCLDLCMKIKVKQLALMKQNFVLAHAEIAKTDATWQDENKRVGEEQTKLATDTEEAAKVASETGWAPNIVDLILQAKPEMENAGEFVLATRNPEATRPQGKALAHLTAVEKYFRKKLAENQKSGASKKKPENPFKDDQKFKLKPREQTAAGGLEKAAQEQAELLSKIEEQKESTPSENQPQAGEKQGEQGQKAGEQPGSGQKPGADGQGQGKGMAKEGASGQGGQGLTGEQRAISQALAQLKNDEGFPEQVRKALDDAHQAASESTGQLEANDTQAAKEPATRTLAHLHSAIASMKAASDRDAAAALDQAQRELNEASNMMKREDAEPKARAAEAREQVAKVRDDLREEAARHQEHGAAASAEQLAKFAKEIEAKKALEELKKLAAGQAGDQEKTIAKIDELAQRAAAEQLRFAQGKQALAQTVSDLKRAATNLQRLAQGSGKASPADRQAMEKELLADVQAAAQKGRASAGSMASSEAAGNLLSAVRGIQGGGNGGADNARAQALIGLSKPIEDLIFLLNDELTSLQRQEVVAQLRPEDAPLAYRKPVAEYFERLSRDYEKTESATEGEEEDEP